jgi:hypothetical protein
MAYMSIKNMWIKKKEKRVMAQGEAKLAAWVLRSRNEGCNGFG